MTPVGVVDRAGEQACVRDGASGGQRWTVTARWYSTPSRLWDAVDGAQVAKPVVTRHNLELSTIHKPYDDHEDTVHYREIAE